MVFTATDTSYEIQEFRNNSGIYFEKSNAYSMPDKRGSSNQPRPRPNNFHTKI